MIALGIIATSLYTTREILKQQHRDTEQRINAIANNLAFGSAHFLLLRDQSALEQLLLQTANYPGMRSITVIDHSHRIISQVRREPGKPAEAVFDYGTITVPTGAIAQYVWQYGAHARSAPLAMGLDATALVLWHPIENSRLGWLRIESGVEASQVEALRLVRNHAVFALLAVVLSILLLLRMLQPSLRAIAGATDFARELTRARGQQMPVFGGSTELAQLGAALNETSFHLYAQEAALKANTELFQAIFSNVKEGIVTWNEAGEIESANAAAEEIFGHVRGGLSGRTIDTLVPRWRDALDASGHADASIDERPTFGQRADGTSFQLEISVGEFTLHDKRSYLGTVRDISVREAAEAELRESELRFRYMLETCPTAARIARAGGRDVIFSNSRYATLINAAPGAVTGVDPANYYAHRSDYEDIVRRLQAGEQIFDRLVELNIPGAGTKWAIASYLPIHYQGAPAVLGWFYDITERKQSEALLRDHAEHTQAILDTMIDGVITIDKHGTIESYNPAAERIFGYPSKDALGQNVRMLMPSPHRESHDIYLKNYQSTGIAHIIGIGREVEGQRKDGSLFPMELAISEITRQGQPMYVGMVRDITERKRVERMKTEFVSTVSHELRTPLTAISGALGLISGGMLGQLPEMAQQMVGIAHKNSQRLTFLINDLLDMEKLVAGKMQFDMVSQPLMPLIEQAIDANRTYGVEHRVKLVLTRTAPDAEIRVDSQRLMQVLSNLISNAIKYSPEEGRVEISVKAENQSVRVTVTDHGSGIPDEFKARIFQKFAQADSSDTRQKGGTGLGLAITRELIERMDGHIGFESELGKGARFFFDLPLYAAHDGSVGHDAPSRTTDAPRILVVEDEPDIANLLSLMLTRAGYAVDTALTGNHALAAIKQTDYAAITLDLMLPDISGLEIIRALRQQAETMALPIIVVSAKMDEGRLAINGDFTGIDWLSKPIREDRLLASLESHLLSENGERSRVLHVEDDTDLHQVIRAMAGARFDFSAATSLAEARMRLQAASFDLVLLDLDLPDGSGWTLLPDIRAHQPKARVVILSGANTTLAQTRQVEAVLVKSQVEAHQLLEALTSQIQSAKVITTNS